MDAPSRLVGIPNSIAALRSQYKAFYRLILYAFGILVTLSHVGGGAISGER